MTDRQQKLHNYVQATAAAARFELALKFAKEAADYPASELDDALSTQLLGLLQERVDRLEARISAMTREMNTW